MKSKVIKKIKMIFVTAAILILAAVIVILFLENKTEKNGHYTPSYSKQNLEKIVENGIEAGEYKELFFQTGLGKPAIDRMLKKDENIMAELKKHQSNFFAENKYDCSRITLITGEEQSVDAEGKVTNKFEIQGLQDGDVLISLSTHSLGWRHGHAAIVVDSKRGVTLESLVLGSDSEYRYYKKWERYPMFIQLRIKDGVLKNLDGDRKDIEEALTGIGMKKLKGKPYGLFAGIPVKYDADIEKTHCAHLVWYAYKELGMDIDSDHGFFVTPYDIAHSDLLEIVQIYGVDPNEYMGNFN